MIRNISWMALILCIVSSTAIADDRDARIEMLEAQMQAMMAEIKTLKTEQKQEQAAYEIERQNDVKITMAPTPKIKSGDFSWQPSGRVHADYAAFDDDNHDHPNGGTLRRARIGMEGDLSADFGYKLAVDFGDDDVGLRDAYLKYTGIENTNIKIGDFKPPFGLEETASSNDISFIERSTPNNAFFGGRALGVGVEKYSSKWSLAGGVFNDSVTAQSTDDEAWLSSARATVTPWKRDDKNLVHLGGSVTYRVPDQADNRFDFDATSSNAVQAIDTVSADFNDAESAVIYGLEGAVQYGPVSVQGEYFIAQADRTNAQDVSFAGGHVQGSWVVTGESRAYKSKNGSFGGLKPDHPFDLKNGDLGALEVAVRHSRLDLNDADILGGETNDTTLGANWHLNDNARLMVNYIFVDTDENAVTPNDDPEILLLRSQVNF